MSNAKIINFLGGVFVFIFLTVCLYAQDVYTVAGNGTYGYNGDGIPATSAELNYPWGVAADSFGNIYIADTNNSIIRKVNNEGVISTVAGTPGVFGYDGDDKLATMAQLDSPHSVAVDLLGNIYIADFNNYRIRKVDTAGIITTIAGIGLSGFSGDGGLAISAEISNSDGIAVDAIGNVYIADSAPNFRIRKVDIAGVITTIAGNGLSEYNGDFGPATEAAIGEPEAVTVDSFGNIYFCDYHNHIIRKVDSEGFISSIAGNGTSGYSGDGGVATQAQLNCPEGIVVDNEGNVYIADYGNNVIRKVNSTGIISTVAGNGNQGNSGDGGPAISAEFYNPSAVSLDSKGDLYIADQYNNLIRKVYSPFLPVPPNRDASQ